MTLAMVTCPPPIAVLCLMLAGAVLDASGCQLSPAKTLKHRGALM